MTVDDINFHQGTISISKAMTLDESGSRTIGSTNNQYSRRVIKMSPPMRKVIGEQVIISKGLQGGSFQVFRLLNTQTSVDVSQTL